jgi:hypothetical protein
LGHVMNPCFEVFVLAGSFWRECRPLVHVQEVPHDILVDPHFLDALWDGLRGLSQDQLNGVLCSHKSLLNLNT